MGNGYEQTLCWICKNTNAFACCWFKDFTPVPGWDAVPTILSTTGKTGHARSTSSYLVRSCPNVDPERGYEHLAIRNNKAPAGEPAETPDKKTEKGSEDMVSKEKQEQMAERQRLYEQGATDVEIAEIQHVGLPAVQQWRKSKGLPAKARSVSGETRKAEQIAEKTPDVPEPEACPECAGNTVCETAPDITARQAEQLQACRNAGMIVSDAPAGEGSDEYTYCGDMSPEDYEKMCEQIASDKADKRYMTVEALLSVLINVPQDAAVVCGECDEGFGWVLFRQEYDVGGSPLRPVVVLGR